MPNKTDRGDLQTALKNAADLLAHDPRLAEEQAIEVLKAYPDTVAAKLTLATAYRLQKMPQKGLDVLAPQLAGQGDSADFLHEIAQCQGGVGRGDEAIRSLRRAVTIDPKHKTAWDSLGHQLAVAGDQKGSSEAFQRHFELSTPHPELVEASRLVREGKLGKAERIVRDVLKKYPTDVSAIKMLSDIGLKMGQLKDASHLLERCLELAPHYHAARHSYVIVLMRRQKPEAAIDEAEKLLAQEPNNPNFLTLKATVLTRIGDQSEALELYEKVLKDYPNQARAQMSYGHTLKTVGRLDEAIEAYKKCISLSPEVGEAYWSLANLKTYRFSDEDIDNMRGQVTTEGGGDADDQSHLAFALGKALEDCREYDESFKFYKRGNAIRRIAHRHIPKVNVLDSLRQVRALPKEIFEQREGWGCHAPGPIFIVGLPRAGSTLLEQILASHSQVEGTTELQDVIAISRKLGNKNKENPSGKYPEILAELTEDQVRELGESYLASTRIHRTDTPFFIDKMPNNFRHIGLIHLILPNSKIIDARRHPMGGCFSGFKQLFARGQTFTYGLEDIGKYYRDYSRVMDHWDAVLPGRVHRVQYEEMVADTEAQICALLDYCGLEFEEQCLRFYETDRAVRTPSSEQVRKPIYKEGLEQWRNFEAYLDPLKEALGPEVRERYSIDL